MKYGLFFLKPAESKISSQNNSISEKTFLLKIEKFFKYFSCFDPREFESPSIGINTLRKVQEMLLFVKESPSWLHLIPELAEQIKEELNKLPNHVEMKDLLSSLKNIIFILYQKTSIDLLSEAKFDSGHAVGMRPTTHVRENQQASDCVSKIVREDYNLALLRSTLKALGIKILDIETKETGKFFDFVRDPVLVLHDLKIVLTTQRQDRSDHEEDIIALYTQNKYQSLKVKNAYFEGGNVIYDANKKFIFHGLNPRGYYAEEYKYPGGGGIPDRPDFKLHYVILPEETNRELKQCLAPLEIQVFGIKLHSDLVYYSNQGNKLSPKFEGHYYHLDCFMHLVGEHLIVLNQKMLAPDSQELLKQKYGNNFIDLAYPDYLTHPLMFNLMWTTHKDRTIIITHPLPELLNNALKKHGFIVITPGILDPSHPSYNSKFSTRVANHLEELGFESVNPLKLAKHVSFKPTYQHADGRMHQFVITERYQMDPEQPVTFWESLDSSNLELTPENTFCVGYGGPHCLTIDVAPCITPTYRFL